MVYEPANKPVNILLICQVVPPSFEYCRLEPVAVIVIEPSFRLGQVNNEGSVFAIELIVGIAG